ncbi:hypothetical protein Q428_00025 [Fervidicella metallireducens AeB]|uniref:Inhibitor of sigma-G Gin n=1 Tax=Fervidicella metallireducens AeB TaxID=1403537 RepID=A0A017RYI9_9CLOT|nr:sigma factor G inhibitor Gin [Fervidicella metallireducens]EYE89848.1 hypothetical protein Q428_00025 [Fervidicella metallireducens AeB]
MRCFICENEIKDGNGINLLNEKICSLCVASIGEIKINHVLYNYYKDKIRDIYRLNMNRNIIIKS